ncbi:carbonic anhydrase [Mucilaginibacter phyllosphaerae]|uniref:Carbonic anhydrase 2 n=1 Tax=Mucilaginibacter phyllosphaerae TaxID=1812349 RepID=A0A4Y8AGR6_9SPHI|nr:carbonic anhydrase [Mucilaginibacter phyllosphaerae]MBB3968416.1 carbonic anhydrase [Mucilaginibacter phyllosphaerae]TEW67936.1 carbonic anhydrase [Mucilaginibacter phyllosphaerae]GGH16139.1 carbonic anhydrase [Mucilaginibacter phyllosphaerae]
MCAKESELIHDTSNITYEGLLEGNKRFVEDTLKIDPNYFKTLANGQKPPILWIGCSDSRVPANQITRTNPGEIFVHRNIANMVIHTDMSMLSVLDYAINVLKVKHVIVTGHYGCGGVLAAMSSKQFGLIDNWLRNIKDVYRLHADELNAIEDNTQRGNRLVELNVIENVSNLCRNSIVQNAWQNGQELSIHGWVYALSTGIIKDMEVSASNNSQMDEIFRFESK